MFSTSLALGLKTGTMSGKTAANLGGNPLLITALIH